MCFCVFSQTSNKSVLAKYTDDEIKIDGVLDETSWNKVLPATNFYQYFPTDTAQAKSQVEIKFMFSDRNLYVGIKVYAKGKDYIIPSLRRDFRGGANDSVTLMFDTLMMALMPFYLAQTLMEFEERCCFLVVEMMLEVLIWHGTRSGPENQKYMIIIIY